MGIFKGAVPRVDPADRTYSVLWPRTAGSLDVTFLSNEVIGLSCHWVTENGQTKKGRTVLCLVPPGRLPALSGDKGNLARLHPHPIP